MRNIWHAAKPDQEALFDDTDYQAANPDFLRVMDLQQEQLACRRRFNLGHPGGQFSVGSNMSCA